MNNNNEKKLLKTDNNSIESISEDYIDVINRQLREPVTNIFASLPLLAESINCMDTEKSSETLQTVYHKSYQLLKSINNISFSSKLLKNVKFSKTPLDFSSLVKSAYESAAMVLPDYFKLELKVEDGCVVNGNTALLTAMVYNLLVNSFDYRRDDYVRVSVSLKLSGGRCVLSYKDNSIGIKPELAQKVFEPYFSRNPYNDGEPVEKMGMGLYIVQQAAKDTGGTVLLGTEFSEGVSFIISIPEYSADRTDVVKSRAKDFMLNKYSELFVTLCDYCNLPDLL